MEKDARAKMMIKVEEALRIILDRIEVLGKERVDMFINVSGLKGKPAKLGHCVSSYDIAPLFERSLTKASLWVRKIKSLIIK